MPKPDFDDAPQWYWAADNGRGTGIKQFELAGERFVVASGQRELWARVRQEINPSGKCACDAFGPEDGRASLAHCMKVFLFSREAYGVSHNRLVLEFAKVRAFAEFIKDDGSHLCNWVSNPVSSAPLPRPAYDLKIEHALGQRIGQTLNLEEDWWV
jgi:hypothetical protein